MAGQTEIANVEYCSLLATGQIARRRGKSPPGNHSRQCTYLECLSGQRADMASVAQDHDAVRKFNEFLQHVTNENEADAFRAKVLNYPKQPSDFGRCERRRRLVENDQLRLAREHSYQESQLPFRSAHIADKCPRINIFI